MCEVCGNPTHDPEDGDEDDDDGCLCEYPVTCGGTGFVTCDGCGGDQCVCAVCQGQELECPGCEECPDRDDDDPDED